MRHLMKGRTNAESCRFTLPHCRRSSRTNDRRRAAWTLCRVEGSATGPSGWTVAGTTSKSKIPLEPHTGHHLAPACGRISRHPVRDTHPAQIFQGRETADQRAGRILTGSSGASPCPTSCLLLIERKVSIISEPNDAPRQSHEAHIHCLNPRTLAACRMWRQRADY